MKNVEGLYYAPQLEKELYDEINLWVKNLEKWLLNSINTAIEESSVNQLLSETKYFQKSFFGDVFDSIKEFFKKVKDKINMMAQNIASKIKTAVNQTILWLKGIETYEIILFEGKNICDTCRKMAGKIYPIDELSIGETAPPFHPNCRCTIIPYTMREDSVNSSGELLEPSDVYNRESACSYARKWYNKRRRKYPYYARGDCANFVSQCLVAGGFKMNDEWYCKIKESADVMYSVKPNDRWDVSEARRKAPVQYEYFKNSNVVSEEVVINGIDNMKNFTNSNEKPIKIGDIMYLQWDKDYPHHATIIAKVEGNMFSYSAHTDPNIDKSITNFFNKYPGGKAYILKIK